MAEVRIHLSRAVHWSRPFHCCRRSQACLRETWLQNCSKAKDGNVNDILGLTKLALQVDLKIGSTTQVLSAQQSGFFFDVLEQASPYMSLLCVFCKIKICFPTIPFQRSEKFPYGEFSSFSRRLLSHAVSVYRPVACKRFDWLKTFQNKKVGIDSLLVITISIARKNQERNTRCHKFKLQLLTIHLRCL